MVGIRKNLKRKFLPPAPTHLKNFKEAIEKPPIDPNAPNNEKTNQHPRVVAR